MKAVNAKLASVNTTLATIRSHIKDEQHDMMEKMTAKEIMDSLEDDEDKKKELIDLLLQDEAMKANLTAEEIMDSLNDDEDKKTELIDLLLEDEDEVMKEKLTAKDMMDILDGGEDKKK